MLKFLIHYGLHFGLPLIIAFIFFKKNWLKVYLIMLSAFIIDLDHLLANPIFDPNRCSINFHPLHTYYAIGVYVVLLFLKRPFKLIGLGLVFHMLTDWIDCLLMN